METKPLEHENPVTEKEDRFETDAQRIVRRHLENEDDVITDEDLRSVRIGQVIPVETNEEGEEKLEELIEEVEKKTPYSDPDIKPNDDPITPWDAVEH
jgi:hypothetical protein